MENNETNSFKPITAGLRGRWLITLNPMSSNFEMSNTLVDSMGLKPGQRFTAEVDQEGQRLRLTRQPDNKVLRSGSYVRLGKIGIGITRGGARRLYFRSRMLMDKVGETDPKRRSYRALSIVSKNDQGQEIITCYYSRDKEH